MTLEIDTLTLQEWLAKGRPVTVLDIRTAEDRSQWWIPGSLHVDAYESLKAGNAGPLLDVDLPQDQPVVTVCGSGRMSLTAAQTLADARGIHALSLSGGMKNWSLAWNTASRSFGPVEVTQVRRTGKGCLSYIVRSGGEAAVIDPSIAPENYVSLAEQSGVRIRYVLDTHVHADHLSRARRLAELSGAELMLPALGKLPYPHTPVVAGDKLPLGETWLEVLATPGHTSDSVTYLVADAGIFSGDTLFLASVGRPDLHASRPLETEARARLLFHSIETLTSLDAHLMVFPGHSPEPARFDDQILTASLGDVAARLGDWFASEDRFVERIVARIPATPPNYLAIAESNRCGEWPDSDPADLEAGANRCAVSS